MPVELMRIRVALPTDAALVARHRAQMFMDMGKLDEAARAAFEELATDRLRILLEQGTYRAWFVLGPEGAVVGGGGVQLRTLLPRPEDVCGKEAIVLNVYVEPAFRRRGVAWALMQQVLAWCSGQGIRRIVLHPSPEGLPLYQSLGFAPNNEMIYRGE
jgi:GNAT superfamily N-acetyltransferase